MNYTNRQLALKWDEYVKNLRRETPVPVETDAEQKKRIKRLTSNFEEFCKYYFPNYTTAEFASWQLRGAKKVIKNDVLYYVRAIAREHAKSVIYGLFVPMYLYARGELKNMLLISRTYDNACELLTPIRLNMEHNRRFVHDFGKQKGWQEWSVGRFITTDSASFRALGSGQNPRGSRNEEARPDFILVDDIDDDEESRNQKRIDDKFKWIEQAVFPAMSISGVKRFGVIGNIISKKSIVVQAMERADDVQQVNILDKKGQPSWKERYSLKDVKYMLDKMSYASGQKEYFNNPISEGSVFKDIKWGKVPPLHRFKFLVAYCDPSYKDSRKNDFKGLPLIGEYKGDFYIITAYLEQTTVAEMIQWFYDIDKRVNGRTAIYNYIENSGLQDTFYEQIFLPKLIAIGKQKGKHLSISPDNRKKTDKFTRIEATLEPLNRQGRLIFNIKEKENPHMQRLEEQFKAIEPGLPAHDDGPDACEGAVWIINNKLTVYEGKAKRNKSRSRKKW